MFFFFNPSQVIKISDWTSQVEQFCHTLKKEETKSIPCMHQGLISVFNAKFCHVSESGKSPE